MKTIENTILVKKADDFNDEILMTSRENFEDVNLCDCYGNYGQIIGCYDAGCYSLDNSEGNAQSDLTIHLAETFSFYKKHKELIKEHVGHVFSNADELIEGIEYIDEISFSDEEIEKIKSEVEDWQENNDMHTEVKAFTFHDSHNFQTVVLESDNDMNDVEELDDDEQEAILEEYPGFPHIEGTNESIETENYIFNFDRWADNPWICSIEKK